MRKSYHVWQMITPERPNIAQKNLFVCAVIHKVMQLLITENINVVQ